MPDLPTLTVTTAQAQRCLAAWGSVAAYKEWLADSVRRYVRGAERAAVLDPIQQQLRDALAALDADDPIDGAT